jgi:hypothetical protein
MTTAEIYEEGYGPEDYDEVELVSAYELQAMDDLDSYYRYNPCQQVRLVSPPPTHTLLDESLRENELIDLKKISGGIYRTMTDEKHMESNILSVEKQIEKELNKYSVCPKINVMLGQHSYMTVEEILEHLVMFEALFDNNRPYYDMDWKKYKDIAEGKSNRNSDITECYDAVISVYPDSENIYVFDDCRVDAGSWKVSVRLIVEGSGYYELQSDIPAVECKFYDDSVYNTKSNKRQLMRMPYMGKYAEESNNGLRMARVVLNDSGEWVKLTYQQAVKQLHETYDDWMIQNIDCEGLVEVSHKINKVNKVNKVGTVNTVDPVDPEHREERVEPRTELIDDKQFALLTMLITTQEWDWMQWRNLGWALKNISDDNNIDLRPAFHKLSSKSNLYDEEATDKIYDVAQPTAKYRLGMQTIIGIVKESHPEQCDMWQTTNKIEWIKEQWEAERVEWDAFEKLDKEPECRDPEFNIWKFEKRALLTTTLEGYYKLCDDIVVEMNKYYTYIMGVKPFVVEEFSCKNIRDNEMELFIHYKSTAGLVSDWENRTLQTNAINPEKPKKKLTIPLKYLWLQHRRRSEKRGIKFDPRGYMYPEYHNDKWYNLFTGFKVPPQSGLKTNLTENHPYFQHLLHRMCGGNRKYYDCLNGFIASLRQQPWVKMKMAVVMMGTEGAGKGVVVQLIRQMLGRKYVALPTKADDVLGNFNSAMNGKLFCFLDEMVWGGDKEKAGVIKKLVSEDTMVINEKFMPKLEFDNFINFMIASNEDWVVPAGKTARRWLCLDVSDELLHDPNKKEIIKSIVDIDIVELAKFYDNYDLTNFETVDPPITSQLRSQKILTFSKLYKWWHDLLCGDEEKDVPFGDVVPKQYVFDNYLRVTRDIHIKEVSFWKSLTHLTGDMKKTRALVQGSNTKCGRMRCVTLPTLQKAQARWRHVMNDNEWPFEEHMVDSDKTLYANEFIKTY